MTLLELDGVSARFGERAILQQISFAQTAGEMLGLIGPNGAGKSTLVKTIAQVFPYRGSIRFNGVPLARIGPQQRARQIAYLSQGDGMHWPMTVEDLVALGRYPYRGGWRYRKRPDGERDREAIETALTNTGLQGFRGRRVDQLSGGERARVRLARALAVQASLLLVDEPVAALDPRHQLKIMNLLRRHCRQGDAVIVVLHDLTLASRFCDRLLLLQDGRLVASGSVKHVLTPRNLAAVYGVHAMIGQYHAQTYAVPWALADESMRHSLSALPGESRGKADQPR